MITLPCSVPALWRSLFKLTMSMVAYISFSLVWDTDDLEINTENKIVKTISSCLCWRSCGCMKWVQVVIRVNYVLLSRSQHQFLADLQCDWWLTDKTTWQIICQFRCCCLPGWFLVCMKCGVCIYNDQWWASWLVCSKKPNDWLKVSRLLWQGFLNFAWWYSLLPVWSTF